MVLTKNTEDDLIELVANNNVQVRTATVIKEDGTEISRTFHRCVIEAGASERLDAAVAELRAAVAEHRAA